MRVILDVFKGLLSDKCEHQRHVMQVSTERVDLAHWLNEPNELYTSGDILHKLTHNFVSLPVLHFSGLFLLLVQLNFFSSREVSLCLVKLVLLNQGRDVGVVSFQEYCLGCFFDLVDVC